MEELFTLALELIGVFIEFVFPSKKRSEREPTRKRFPRRKRILKDSRVSQKGTRRSR